MKYYALVFVLAFFVAIYNLYTYDQHKKETCARKDPGMLIDFDFFIDQGTVASNAQLGNVCLGIGIIYVFLVFFLLVLIVLVSKFSNTYPSKFYGLGCCDNLLGKYVKCFQRFIIIINYVAFIMIGVQWILIFTGQCDLSITTTSSATSTKVKTDAVVANMISTIVWFLLFCGGFFIRGCLFYEAFMYSPDPSDGAAFVTYCFKKCGP